MKQFTSKNQKIGETGEDLVVRFLVKHGFSIKERNFTKKAGEIDIVAEQNGRLHFVEVKTVSHVTITRDVSRETLKIRPEEQFHVKKFQRFTKTIEIYLSERNVSHETSWQIDLLCVYLDIKNKKARVIPFWNVVM